MKPSSFPVSILSSFFRLSFCDLSFPITTCLSFRLTAAWLTEPSLALSGKVAAGAIATLFTYLPDKFCSFSSIGCAGATYSAGR